MHRVSGEGEGQEYDGYDDYDDYADPQAPFPAASASLPPSLDKVSVTGWRTVMVKRFMGSQRPKTQYALCVGEPGYEIVSYHRWSAVALWLKTLRKNFRTLPKDVMLPKKLKYSPTPARPNLPTPPDPDHPA